jgi:hypothetical protein
MLRQENDDPVWEPEENRTESLVCNCESIDVSKIYKDVGVRYKPLTGWWQYPKA